MVGPLLALAALPALADTVLGPAAPAPSAPPKPPPRLVFSFSGGLTADDNPDLSAPAKDGGLTATARLGLELNLARPFDSLTFKLDGQARTGAGEDGLRDRGLSLGYRRDTGQTRIGLSLSARQSPVSLSELATLPDGTVSPTDIVATTGTVDATQGSLSLQTGLQAPLGFSVQASYSGRVYSAPNAVSVYDSHSRSLSAGADWHLTAADTLSLTAAADATDYDNTLQTRQRDRSLSLGYGRALRPDLMLQASLTEGISTSRALGVTLDRSSGLSGSLGLSQTLGNGTASVTLATSRDVLGTREMLSFGRSLKLPAGTFSATAGVSARTGGDAQAVGSLAWAGKLPLDTFGLNLSRQVTVNADNADQASTALTLSWSHAINPSARLGLALNLAATGGAGEGSVAGASRQSLSATWTRDLVADWQLTAGYQLRNLDQSDAASARSDQIFLTLGRKITLLP